jgi:hypothetical protein
MKIRSVGAELFCADRRTDRKTDRRTHMTKLIGAFRNFAIASNRNAVYWDEDHVSDRLSVRDLLSATKSSVRFS